MALSAADMNAFKLIEKEQLTHNTSRFRFELPAGSAKVTVASCIVTMAMLPGEAAPVFRPYTPTSSPDADGYMDLVIKVYEEGKMSKHIDSLAIGDTLMMKGPIPKLPYTAGMVKKIGMIAGGTGITPMLQVIDAIAGNPEDTTEVVLVYASNSEEDIILKDRIDAVVAAKKNITVHYVVGKEGKDTSMIVGHITRELLDKAMPKSDEDCKVLVCGPPGLMNFISGNKVSPMDQGPVVGLLADMGFDASKVVKF
jgi:cytochrome-b5 reductase